MGRRPYNRRSGRSRPQAIAGSPVQVRLPEYDGDATIDGGAVRFFKVDLAQFAETLHVRIRKGIALHDGVHSAKLREGVLYIVVQSGGADIPANQLLAAAALKQTLESYGVAVAP